MTKVARDKSSPIMKNIRKRLLLEFFNKTAVLKTSVISFLRKRYFWWLIGL